MKPRIILDENLHSKRLIKSLKKKGLKAMFLGSGVKDIDIQRFMEKNPDTVLITADKELDMKFSERRSFLVDHYQKPETITTLVWHYMWQFKDLEKIE